MKLDLLVLCAHPDDAELGCGATLIKHAEMGYKTGVIDLTAGEMGTRGTPEIRAQETEKASQLLKLSIRENLGFRDGWIVNDEAHKMVIIRKIRQYRPDIVITNAPEDRHPDHGRASELVKEAAWLAGLKKIETLDENGNAQQAWRPRQVLHFIQYKPLQPDLIVDVKGYVDKKLEAVMAYSSQFYNPANNEGETLIAKASFMELIRARLSEIGSHALIEYGEGFIMAFKPAVDDLMKLK